MDGDGCVSDRGGRRGPAASPGDLVEIGAAQIETAFMANHFAAVSAEFG